MAIGQLVGPRELLGGVARIHRAVAIGVLRIRRATEQAAQPFGIGLADDDRRVLAARGTTATISKPLSIARSWLLIAHADVAVDEPRRALGVEADVVERRAGLAGRVVRAAQAVLEEVAQELLRARAVGPGDVRPADPRGRAARASRPSAA